MKSSTVKHTLKCSTGQCENILFILFIQTGKMPPNPSVWFQVNPSNQFSRIKSNTAINVKIMSVFVMILNLNIYVNN